MKTDLSHPRFQRKKKEPFLLSSKFIAVFFVVSLLLPLLALAVFSHPGRTDSYGGHYNRSTGEYHYHHGYPAHQHPNGVCPYNNDNKTASKETTADDDSDSDYDYDDDDYDYDSDDDYFDTTEPQSVLTTKKDETQAPLDIFSLLTDPEVLWFASPIILAIVVVIMAVILRKRGKDIDELQRENYRRNDEIRQLEKENSKLKENLRQQSIKYENALKWKTRFSGYPEDDK